MRLFEEYKEPKKSYFAHLGANLFQKRDPDAVFNLDDEEELESEPRKASVIENKEEKEKKEEKEETDGYADYAVGLVAPFTDQIRKGVIIFSILITLFYVIHARFFGSSLGGEDAPPSD